MNLYGQKVDIKKLRSIVGKKVFIIEDSAQSHLRSVVIIGRAEEKPVVKRTQSFLR